MNKLHKLLVIAVLSPLAAQGADVNLAPLSEGDFAPATIGTAPDTALANTSRDTVSFAWPLDRPQRLQPAQPFMAQSRAYRLSVTGADFDKGVAVVTTAPGALISVYPLGGGERAAIGDIEIVTGARAFSGDAAMSARVGAGELAETPFAGRAGITAFRLQPSVGAGELLLRGTAAAPDQRYVVEVLDAGSDVALTLQAGQVQYFAGDQIDVAIGFSGDVDGETVDAFLLAPDGTRSKVRVRGDGANGYVARVAVAADAALQPGALWELHANASAVAGELTVPRMGKTAFAVTRATARYASGVEVRSDDSLRLALPVEAAANGRYEARALVFGTDESGQLQPLAGAATARWIEAGEATIVLEVGADLLAQSGLGAPYVVRDLRLTDQSRLAPLHAQAYALTIR